MSGLATAASVIEEMNEPVFVGLSESRSESVERWRVGKIFAGGIKGRIVSIAENTYWPVCLQRIEDCE